MVAKGHHFPGVALAAVVDADTGLALPDFRAEERAFQLVTQLAGRSGRDAPGKVLVQTFQPDATTAAHAVNHDVAASSPGQLERREELGYPPYRHLVSILVAGPERGRPDSRRCARCAQGWVEDDLLGPAPVLRLRGRHRAQLLAKTTQPRSVAPGASAAAAAAAPTMRATA